MPDPSEQSAFDVTAMPGLVSLWTQTLGDPEICIAVLDGPVDLSHPALAGANLTRLETLVPGAADLGPATRHGTHAASIIFGRHDGPVKGIAPRCRGLVVPIFRDGPDGGLAPCSQIDLARALTQAVQAGAHVINVSGGEYSPSGTAHPILADAVAACANSGALIVAAAGNEGCECLHVPGALPGVLAVGAMNARGEPLEFSNWGAGYRTQGLLAAGENIPGAVAGGGTAAQTGTSSATAVVAGVAGLLLSLQRMHGGKPDPLGIRKKLLETAHGCEYHRHSDCRRILAGRLNIAGTSILLKEGAASMSEPSDTGGAVPTPESQNVESGAAVAAAGSAPQTREPQAEPRATSASTAEVAPHPHSAVSATGTAERESPPSMDARESRPARTSGVAEAAVTASTSDAPSADEGQVRASTCGCGCGGNTPAQLVFALGQLGFDYGTEARRDSIMQHMKQPANPHDPGQLLAYLEDNPWDATDVIWTLNFDATPVYAVQPQGAFAGHIAERLRQFLKEHLEEGVERISIPGWIVGSARLFTGQVVPVIHPVLRGMYSWTVAALVEAVCGKPPAGNAAQKEKDAYGEKSGAVGNFFQRVYHELRNFGVTSQERAINYSATNALLVSEVFEQALADEMQLDTIEVERSPICRPGSDCWDVLLTFFDPGNLLERARKVYRFCCDVSDPVPCMVGPVRSWSVR